MKRNLTTHLLTTFTALLVALFLTAGQASAQGFIKNYTATATNHSLGFPRVDSTTGGYCLTGMMSSNVGGNEYVFFQLNTDGEGTETALTKDTFTFPNVVLAAPLNCGQVALVDFQTSTNSLSIISKVDANGSLLWRDTLAQLFPGGRNDASICGTSDGGIMLVGTANFFIQKLDADGNLLFTVVPNPVPTFASVPVPTPDGGALVNMQGFVNNTVVNNLIKIASNCSVEWSVQIPNSDGGMQRTSTASDGSHLVLASSPNLTYSLLKYAPDGTLLWNVALSSVLGAGLGKVYHVLATNDNGAIISARVGLPGLPLVPIIARFDASGNLLWKKVYTNQQVFVIISGMELADGSFVLAGLQGSTLMLLKINANGQIMPNALSGKVVEDANNDCVADASETPLYGWIVRANALGVDYFAVTDKSGNYLISDLPGGPSYFIDLTVLPPSYVWLPCSPPALIMPADTTDFTLDAQVAVGKFLDCPVMTVDIGMPLMRRCANRTFSINYCNSGTLDAEDAAVEVYLPDEIEMVSSPSSYTQTGQTIRFELGDVLAGACGLIQFVGFVSCDSVQLGQTLCLEAHIFPDSFCVSPGEWSGASLEADASCLGDTVRLSLQNTGSAPTTQSLEYLIIDDDVVMRQGIVPAGFPASGIKNMLLPADGSTLRIVVEQEPNHPTPGNPSLAVEGCGGFTLGYITPFSNFEGNPFGDIECREVVGSYDPNEKQAYPQGIHSEHFIEPRTPLTYVLHFQNTGTDTAFLVVLRDTLSPWLDPATVRPGASSYPYTWTMTGQGNLKFTFDPIALPDSNANQEASNGFVQFAIQMRPDVPLGTVIENRVGIYFDQNPVVLTNTVHHTVDTGFLEIHIVSTSEVRSVSPLSVRPNPAADVVSILLNDEVGGEKSLVLTDAFGKTVLLKTFSGGRAELRRGELPAGIYFAKIVENERVVAVGKVVWR